MSNPAVTFGCCLLPSMVGRSSFPLGLRARRTVADPQRVLRIWGVGLLISSSENSVMAKFAECLLPRNPVPGRWLNILRAARGPRTSSLAEVEYPPAALGKDEPVDDAAGVVIIRHPDEDAYFARQAQWRAGVAHRGSGPAERASVQGEEDFFPCRS